MNLKNLLVCSILGLVLLVAANESFKNEFPVTPFLPRAKQVTANPLDAILGEKMLDDGTLRKDNFRSVLQLKASFLRDSSDLYAVWEVTKDVFVLTRKNFYFNNRKYSLFVKTRGNQIVAYHPLNDFQVRDAVYSDGKIYFIGDDYTEIASPWRPKYAVKIGCFDPDFREQWNTSSKQNRGYFFFGIDLKLQENELIARIGIQNEGSSTMCVDHFDLTLTKQGKITRSVYSGGYSCGGRNSSGTTGMSDLFEFAD